MKKVMMMCFMLVIAFNLLCCNNERKKVTINFKTDDASYSVEVDKGTVISDDIIPAVQMKNIKLYYDKNYSHEYSNEAIEQNTDIYLKEDVNLTDEACNAYLEKFIKPRRKDAVIEDVWLFDYLGIYDGVFVGVFLDKKNCEFIEVVCEVKVADIVFQYSYGYDILVYDGTDFINLLEAYNQSKLTYEDILQIYKLHINIDS